MSAAGLHGHCAVLGHKKEVLKRELYSFSSKTRMQTRCSQQAIMAQAGGRSGVEQSDALNLGSIVFKWVMQKKKKRAKPVMVKTLER